MAVERFSLTATSQVVEIASNDGYLLQYSLPKASRYLALNQQKTLPR